jgi:hypothetical protein
LVAAALILAAGGFALTVGIISGDKAMMDRLLEAFLMAFSARMVAIVAYTFPSKQKED